MSIAAISGSEADPGGDKLRQEILSGLKIRKKNLDRNKENLFLFCVYVFLSLKTRQAF